MKLSACYVVYDDINYLELSLGSIYNAVDKIYFLHNSKPWRSDPRPERYEKAKQHLQTLCNLYPKCVLVPGTWDDEHTQRNFGLKLAKQEGFSHQLIIDTDEVYDISEMLNFRHNILASNPTLPAFHLSWNTYFKKDPLYRIEPRETFQPLFCVNVNQFLFYDKRQGMTSDEYGLPHQSYLSAYVPPHVLLCHHFSYAIDDETLKLKLSSTMHSHEILSDWYENVWQKWTPEMKNLHPIVPAQYYKAVKVNMFELPKLIQNFFNKKT